MSGLLDGKVVLINGGTQGVGGASARAAVREGAQVVVTGRRVDAGKRFAAELEELGGDVRFVQTDMADPQQARRSVTRTVEEFGRIDGLCNAAGITTRGTLLDTTPELFDTHIAVNLRGPFFAMQAAAADMVERGTAGSIVNIISIAEHGGQGYLAPYVAAWPASPATLPTRIDGTASASTVSTSAGPTAKANHRPSEASTRPTTTGPARPPRRCRWANSASPTRSPRSSCCCCRRAAGW
jgi:NADP-dependent 3-hydroxy acid dehydrogenase YdfG